LLSCADYDPIAEEVEPEEMRKGPPPWHLWGDTQTIQVDTSIVTLTYATRQLAKVSYGRPETFDFFFGAKIVEVNSAATMGGIEVWFDVTIGVGRSHMEMPGFEYFAWDWSALPVPYNRIKYSTSVLAPQRDDGVVAENVITEITAQDIQVQARVLYGSFGVPNSTAKVEVTCFWAPSNHIRPEWFKGEFPGGEDNGT
jgi:hypothetical protein